MPLKGSAPLSLAGVDVASILKGAAIAAAGALLTYGTQYVTSADFGPWTPVVVAGWSIVVNVVRKFITDTRPA